MGSAVLDRFDDKLLRQLFDALHEGYTTDAEYGLMEKLAKSASVNEKAAMIEQLFAGETEAREEKVIYQIMSDTPYADNQFYNLLEKLDDPTRIADEISSDSDAATIGRWIAEAYSRADETENSQLGAYMAKLSLEHREGAISGLIDKLEEDDNLSQLTGAQALTIAKNLFSGDTNEAEEDAVVKLLAKLSDRQFAALIDEGGTAFLDQVGAELDLGDFPAILKRLTDLGDKIYVSHLYDYVSDNYSGESDTVAYNFLESISGAQLNSLPHDLLHQMHTNLDNGWTDSAEYTAMGWLENADNW